MHRILGRNACCKETTYIHVLDKFKSIERMQICTDQYVGWTGFCVLMPCTDCRDILLLKLLGMTECLLSFD